MLAGIMIRLASSKAETAVTPGHTQDMPRNAALSVPVPAHRGGPIGANWSIERPVTADRVNRNSRTTPMMEISEKPTMRDTIAPFTDTRASCQKSDLGNLYYAAL